MRNNRFSRINIIMVVDFSFSPSDIFVLHVYIYSTFICVFLFSSSVILVTAAAAHAYKSMVFCIFVLHLYM